MFTFGLFTTHIPYIAFVVFYAYFLLFGVEKASKGEIQTYDKSFITEFQVVKHVNADDILCYYYQSHSEASGNFKAFLFKPKIKHREQTSALFHQFDILSSLFNRPPPCFN